MLMLRSGKISVRENDFPFEGGQRGAAQVVLSVIIAFALVLGIDHEIAFAQEAKPNVQAPAPNPAASDTVPAPVIDENAASARMFLDKVEVLGTVAKPQALFIIPGRDPKVDGIEIDRSFFREIFRPYEKDYHPANTRRYLKEQVVW